MNQATGFKGSLYSDICCPAFENQTKTKHQTKTTYLQSNSAVPR